MVQDHMYCALGPCSLLHGSHLRRVSLAMCTHPPSMGQVYTRDMHQYHRQLVRQCRLLHLDRLYHPRVAHVSHLYVDVASGAEVGPDGGLCLGGIVSQNASLSIPYEVQTTDQPGS